MKIEVFPIDGKIFPNGLSLLPTEADEGCYVPTIGDFHFLKSVKECHVSEIPIIYQYSFIETIHDQHWHY